jgi:hypothetical protein
MFLEKYCDLVTEDHSGTRNKKRTTPPFAHSPMSCPRNSVWALVIVNQPPVGFSMHLAGPCTHILSPASSFSPSALR